MIKLVMKIVVGCIIFPTNGAVASPLLANTSKLQASLPVSVVSKRCPLLTLVSPALLVSTLIWSANILLCRPLISSLTQQSATHLCLDLKPAPCLISLLCLALALSCCHQVIICVTICLHIEYSHLIFLSPSTSP